MPWERAQDFRCWVATIRDAVNVRIATSANRPRWASPKLQVIASFGWKKQWLNHWPSEKLWFVCFFPKKNSGNEKHSVQETERRLENSKPYGKCAQSDGGDAKSACQAYQRCSDRHLRGLKLKERKGNSSGYKFSGSNTNQIFKVLNNLRDSTWSNMPQFDLLTHMVYIWRLFQQTFCWHKCRCMRFVHIIIHPSVSGERKLFYYTFFFFQSIEKRHTTISFIDKET